MWVVRNKTKNNKKEIRLWVAQVIVPIMCALVTSGIIGYMFANQSTQIIYQSDGDLSNFISEEYFPLEVGNYWVYDYTHQYTTADRDENNNPIIKTESGKLKMTVLNETKFLTGSLFEVSGNVFTCTVGEKCYYLMISNKIYEVDESVAAKIINNTGQVDFWAQNQTTPDLIFELPFFDGQVIIDSSTVLRDDGFYRWNVQKVNTKIIMKDKAEIVDDYLISYFSNPDELAISFRPQIGILEVTYGHHGTLDEFDLILSDYKIN